MAASTAVLCFSLLASWLAVPAAQPAPVAARAALGDDWRAALTKGNQLYEKKDYAGSIAELEKVLSAADAPDQAKASAAYNIGCDHALAGANDKAVEFVVKAIDLGFLDFDHIRSDADLTKVVNDPKIADAMKRNQAKKDAADAEQKKAMEETRKRFDVEGMKQLPAALEKLKDGKGAGFEFAFDLKTIDGKPITTKDLAGKVAVVDIWGTWCPPCRLEISNFVEVVNRHKNDAFAMVGLNDEDRKQNADPKAAADKVKSFAHSNGINYTLALIDTKTIKQVPEFSGYPTTLFLDRSGKVRLAETGYRPAEYIDAIVKALLGEAAAKQN
ncbi:MAG: TlpA disulfide reductase family protein [Planctomycetota bacterium]